MAIAMMRFNLPPPSPYLCVSVSVCLLQFERHTGALIANPSSRADYNCIYGKWDWISTVSGSERASP
jgi:hypothetical protein